VCQNLVHLAPRELNHQKCLKYRLTVEPTPAFFAARDDYFGNRAEYFSIENGHRRLEITAESTVEVINLEETPIRDVAWEDCVTQATELNGTDGVDTPFEPMHAQFTFPSPRVPLLAELRDYAAKSFLPERSIVHALVDLNVRIHHEFKFDTRATTVDTPLWEVLTLRRGVCQDFAHLATGCLRSMGLAARYVSGYLRTTPPPGKTRLVGADASHAWCSAWCGPLGWVDIDPTNNCLVGDSYITIAWGRDYSDVCPIQGVFVGGGEHRISVSVDVAPVL
jgi:transglutaminase-like putative cysteine protease